MLQNIPIFAVNAVAKKSGLEINAESCIISNKLYIEFRNATISRKQYLESRPFTLEVGKLILNLFLPPFFVTLETTHTMKSSWY